MRKQLKACIKTKNKTPKLKTPKKENDAKKSYYSSPKAKRHFPFCFSINKKLKKIFLTQ